MKNMLSLVLLLSIININLSVKAEEQIEPEGTVFGAGIGYNFGVFGASIDLPVANNTIVSFGLGQTPDSRAYNIGYRYYLREQNVIWRPRFGFQYGTNGVVEKGCWFFSCDDETFEGVSLAIGQSFSFGQSLRHGFTLDFIFKLSDGGMKKRQAELESEGWITGNNTSDISISVGYKYRFRNTR